MKKFICQICAVCLLSAILCMTGCGFFSEEAIQIEDVVFTTLENGDIRLTITYVDDMRDPDVYTIPKGNTGDEGPTGNGIEDIDVVHDDEKKITTLTITYTDKENFPEQIITVPDGISIVDIQDVYDEITGTHTLTFISSNPEVYQFAPINIPRGEKGDPGNGIDVERSEVRDVLDENGKVIGKEYIIYYTQSDETDSLVFPNPTGIATIEGVEDGNTYYLEITYDNATEPIRVPFTRPKDPNQWHTLNGNPNIQGIEGANPGDFCFDIDGDKIYVNEGGVWSEVVDLGLATNKYYVTFDLNTSGDGGPDASMPTAMVSYPIVSGTYFYYNGYTIPTPSRPGYKFKGWYTTKSPDPAVNGHFTDLTPVLSNLTLYAMWEKIEP